MLVPLHVYWEIRATTNGREWWWIFVLLWFDFMFHVSVNECQKKEMNKLVMPYFSCSSSLHFHLYYIVFINCQKPCRMNGHCWSLMSSCNEVEWDVRWQTQMAIIIYLFPARFFPPIYIPMSFTRVRVLCAHGSKRREREKKKIQVIIVDYSNH